MDPRVTLVLLTYNRADDLLTTIQHLLSLPERPPLVVVDNGSTDGTTAVVTKHFPTVQLITLPDNRGAAGRNIGVRRAATPYVALCDDDAWWSPRSLGRAADLLDAHPRLAIVSARVLVGPEQHEDPACLEMASSPIRANGSLPGRPILGFLAGASVLRRSAFLQIGGFHPRLFLGGEEALLAWDLAAHGGAMAYVPELLVHHYPSPRRDVTARRRLLLRNALWLAWLRRPARAALYQTARLLTDVLRDPALWPGLAQAIRGLSWILRERQVLPSHLEAALRELEKKA
jgi:GT2 family glycosyltransferase